MSNNKQNSIQYLGWELNNIFCDISPELWDKVNQIFEQAKAMHKNEELELINFTSKIFELGKSEFSYALLTNEEILEFYNELYGGNK